MKIPFYEILGIGSPCVDHILKVSDDYLATVSGEKEGMEPVDYPTFVEIVRNSGVKPILVAGGSCCNTIKGLSKLGRKCAIHGTIGNDPVAKYFFKTIHEHNIILLLIEVDKPTTQVACLVNSNGHRTCRDYLGASKEFKESDLDPRHFEEVKLVHIEGYTLFNGSLTLRAMEMAKAAGAKISFDVSSFEIVEKFKDTILFLIEEYVDLLFANQKEIYALTHIPEEKEACHFLKQYCEVVVAMAGGNGCFVAYSNRIHHYPAFKVNAVDTTGAGDLFASGFLHHYLKGSSMQQCAYLGALVASEVIQTIGAEIPPSGWDKIRLLA